MKTKLHLINTYDDVSLQVEVAGLTNCRHIGGVTNCVNYTNIHLRSTTYENNRNDQPKNYYYQIILTANIPFLGVYPMRL